MGETIYGYPAREDIVAGQAYTVTMPQGMRDKRFADAVALVKGIGERPGSKASYDSSTQAWTVTLGAEAKAAVDDLRLAEAKYGADVVQIPGDSGYAQASDDHAAVNTPKADPFAGLPNADDSLNGEFSPAQPASTEDAERAGSMSNASDNIPKAQPLTGAGAQVNWDLLRRSVERDLASARAASKRTGDFSDHRAYAYQLVLDSMDVFEFGLAYWRAKTQAERDAQAAPGTEFRDCSCGQRVYLAQRGWYHWIDGSPVPACAPGLAERTQAAPPEPAFGEPHDEGTSYCTAQPEHQHRCRTCGRVAEMMTAPCGDCPDHPLRRHTQAACDTIKAASE